MNKLEMVKGLNDSKTQLQIVAAVRTLQQITQQMSDDLKVLPEAISKEVSPLVVLEQRVEEIAEAQRAAISALVEEISGQTKKGLKEVSDQIQLSAQALKPLPDLLKALKDQEERNLKAQAKRELALDTVTKTVEDRINRIQPRWWSKILGLLLVGIVSAVLMGIGPVVFERLVPASGELLADKMDAESYRLLHQKATKEQWEAIDRIINQ